MKVLHVLNELRASGAEVMLAQAAPIWRQRGVQSDVVATGAELGSYAKRLRAAGCTLHHLPFAPSPSFLRQFGSLVRRERYDVVHVHSERASFWYALIARAAGARAVRTVHNVFAYEGSLRLERRLQRALLRRVGVQTVSVSESVQANESSAFENPSLLIHNWVDTMAYRPPTSAERVWARCGWHVGPQDVVMVSVGNCAPAKNHEQILHALSMLPPNVSWVYLHAGEEDAGHEERALAQNLGVAERCRFLGRVDSVMVLRAADVYLMPSHYEGMSIAALEALSMGVPLVLGDRPGLRELKHLGLDSVLWVEPVSDAIMGAIKASLGTPYDEQVAWARYNTVRERFGVDRGTTAYELLYRQLVPSKADRIEGGPRA